MAGSRPTTQRGPLATSLIVTSVAVVAICVIVAAGSNPTSPSPDVDQRSRPGLWIVRAGAEVAEPVDVAIPPTSFAIAADRNEAWILAEHDVVGVLPSGVISRTPLIGHLSTIAADRHLGVWIGGGRSGHGVVWGLDPGSGVVLSSTDPSSRVDMLALQDRGAPPAVWGYSPALGIPYEVDASSGELLGSNYFGEMTDIAGDGRRVWMSDPAGVVGWFTSLVIRSAFFHESSAKTRSLVPRADAIAASVGSIWVLDRPGRRVLRLDRDTGEIEASIRVGAHPLTVVASRGTVWVASANTLTRIDGDASTTTTISVDGRVIDIGVDADAGGEVPLWILMDETPS